MATRNFRTEFEKLRQSGDFNAMGWWFWNLFLTLDNGKDRDAVKKLWRSLSKRQQAKCEQA